ncbi:MAG TPA: hypothetical protein VJT50_15375, partial [Pyrinomonadaceae bacterium]|nr:hypothetical protein [Pyrinomonadaceae bacterium]
AGFAYLATIVANTARICLALWLRTISHDVGWIDQEQLHRLEGIVVYFGFLLLLFVYQQKYSTRLRNLQSEPKAGPRPRTLYDFRFPLLIYYGTAVGIPLLTAVYRQTEVPVDFQQHLLFVLFIPLVIIVPCECFRRYEHNRKTPKPTSTVSLVSSTR